MKLSKIIPTIGMAALVFSACDSGTSSDESQEMDFRNSNTYLNTYPELNKINDVYQLELYQNYIWLDLAYLYGHMRNELDDNYRVYLGRGTAAVNEVKGYCTPDYYDVCYMYNQMLDPFTQYFDPNVKDLVYKQITETQEVVGIGAEVEIVESEGSSYLVITQVYPSSPSDEAGLMEGDIIKEIDGLAVTTVENFEKMCAGKKGSLIKVTVDRGGEIVTVSVKLDEYHAPSVKVHYENSIPVIEILEFSKTTSNDSGTYGEFLEALMRTEGAPSTIIDLRSNPGGDTKQCNAVSAELLSSGDTIITDIVSDVDSVRDGGRWKFVQVFDTVTYTATKDGIGRDRYYVLMSSDTSASCAEVVLSAVSVNKKTPIVGVTSYGKGIGQAVMSTESGIQGLALITALQGVDKNGESYHDLGIVPDFPIVDPDEQMAKAVELAKEMTYVRTAGYGKTKLNHFSKSHETKENKIPNLKDLKIRYFEK